MKVALKDVGSCPRRIRRLILKRKLFSQCGYVGDRFTLDTYGDETGSGGTREALGDAPEIDDDF